MRDTSMLNPDSFINRELSVIDFNRRILALAQNPAIPLLERLKFIAIIGNNLDEFYMVRVSSYVQKLRLGIITSRPDGLTPSQLLVEIRRRASALMNEQRQTLQDIYEQMAQEGIYALEMAQVDAHEKAALRSFFYEEIFPVVTPLAADHARPFPFISNLSLNLGVYLEREEGEDLHHHLEFVRIKVPEALPRIVSLNKVLRKYGIAGEEINHLKYVWLEDVIAENLDLLFPGMRVIETHPFRITRNADIDYEHEQEEELSDMSAVIEESLRERRFGSVVRLSVPETISERMLTRLIHELDVDPEREVYPISGALGSSGLFELYAAIDRPEHKYPTHVPRVPEFLAPGKDIFTAIRNGDILLHHPYDSFGPVEEFFAAAARDPDVLAIKATLYRVGKNSPIVQSLMEARDNDKQVAVLVELKARFDEENNLEWARALEDKGVHVTYGVEELSVKTHAKISLVVRREGEGLRRYVHLSTGNYNAGTARLYTDIGLFTCAPQIGDDATRLFNRLTGYAPKTYYQRLLVAPEYILPTFVRLIDNEIEAAQAGKPARLIFKMNQLEEDVTIQKLYEASQAGVKVNLIIRGLCCLLPGVHGLSENIRVFSILGRFLEHSRIYYFHNAPPEQRFYVGSADIMRRNLYNRVETIFPVIDPRLQRRLKRMLYTDLRSTENTWELLADRQYYPRVPADPDEAINNQAQYMRDSFGLELTQNIDEWWDD
jgi:polyphosphate kinase